MARRKVKRVVQLLVVPHDLQDMQLFAQSSGLTLREASAEVRLNPSTDPVPELNDTLPDQVKTVLFVVSVNLPAEGDALELTRVNGSTLF